MKTPTGSQQTRLVVLRGNSASGKSSVAAQIRARYGRGLAIISQDVVRRQILKEKDSPGAVNIAMIDLMARHALNRGFHVVVEGIMYADRYGDMLCALLHGHRGVSRAYYFDLPFAVTVKRHTTKPVADEYGEAELRNWYRSRDLLPGGSEAVIDEHSTIDQTVNLIMAHADLR